MPTINEIRRQNFLWLFQHASGKNDYERYEALGIKDAGYGSQLKIGTRGIGPKTARKIENAVGQDAGWMDQIHADSVHEPRGGYDIRQRARMVPVISFVQAGEWCEIIDLHEPGHADDWVPVRARKAGERAYALKVEGDSMTNPTGAPTFPAGTIVVIDPEQEARPGDFVIAKMSRDQEATFKQLWQEAGKLQLRPLNPNYPRLDITEDTHICGRLVAIVTEF